MSDCLSLCMSVCLFLCMSVCLSLCISVCLSLCMSVCLSLCISVCLSLYMSVCLSLCMSVCLSLFRFVCVSLCKFICCLSNYENKIHFQFQITKVNYEIFLENLLVASVVEIWCWILSLEKIILPLSRGLKHFWNRKSTFS